MKKILLLVTVLLFVHSVINAHGDEGHHKKINDTLKAESNDTLQSAEESVQPDHDHGIHEHSTGNIKADFSDFPTLHPLVVHFPIVLLLVAAFSQLTGLFFFKKELSWVTLALVFGGVIGAYASGNFVHPHTAELPEKAAQILEQHELLAGYTIWLSLAALVLKLISHFVLKRKWWGELIVAIALVASGYTVSTAGHYGAQLVHLEGVGPKGKFLETQDDDEHDHHSHTH